MRFVHTADWQLGMTRYFLNGEAQPRYSAARREVVAGLRALAEEAEAEFVVVAGDVFEHNQLAPRVVSQSLEAMRGIGVPVYLLPGNHDPLDASSVYTSALFTAECPDNVTVLDGPGVHRVRPGLEIVAAPWTSKAPTTDLVAEVIDDLPADGTTRVVVGHGAVDIFVPDKDRPSLIQLAARRSGDRPRSCALCGVGRQALSHAGRRDGPHLVLRLARGHQLRRHRTRPRTRVGGRHRRRRPGQACKCRAATGGPVEVRDLHHAVDNSRDIADLDINLDLMSDKERTVVRLALTGSLTVTDKAALDACLDKYARLFAALGLWERQSEIAVIPADGEFDDLGIGGFAAAAVDELVAAARSDGEDADDARAALSLLLRLVDRGIA